MRSLQLSLLVVLLWSGRAFCADSGLIEKQLQEIGSVSNDEVVVVQRQFTKKAGRHELTPVTFGGVPFGTVRRSLFGGAAYTFHLSEGVALEAINFAYTKNFFSSFTDDINANKIGNEASIKPDFQKLLYFLTTGIQLTPTYGKISTFSKWIAYLEPYFSLGAGIAKTETNTYFTFYPGLGLRAYFKEWLSMKLELRNYIYSERIVDRVNSIDTTTLRHNYAVMLSLSFWLPKIP